MLAPLDLVFKAFYVDIVDLFSLLLIGSSDLKTLHPCTSAIAKQAACPLPTT